MSSRAKQPSARPIQQICGHAERGCVPRAAGRGAKAIRHSPKQGVHHRPKAEFDASRKQCVEFKMVPGQKKFLEKLGAKTVTYSHGVA